MAGVQSNRTFFAPALVDSTAVRALVKPHTSFGTMSIETYIKLGAPKGGPSEITHLAEVDILDVVVYGETEATIRLEVWCGRHSYYFNCKGKFYVCSGKQPKISVGTDFLTQNSLGIRHCYNTGRMALYAKSVNAINHGIFGNSASAMNDLRN